MISSCGVKVRTSCKLPPFASTELVTRGVCVYYRSSAPSYSARVYYAKTAKRHNCQHAFALPAFCSVQILIYRNPLLDVWTHLQGVLHNLVTSLLGDSLLSNRAPLQYQLRECAQKRTRPLADLRRAHSLHLLRDSPIGIVHLRITSGIYTCHFSYIETCTFP